MLDEGLPASFFDLEDAKDAKTGPPKPSHGKVPKTKKGDLVGSDANGTEEEARQFADWLDLKR